MTTINSVELEVLLVVLLVVELLQLPADIDCKIWYVEVPCFGTNLLRTSP